MRGCLNWLMLLSLLWVTPLAAAEEKQPETKQPTKPFLTLKLVDEQGKPVEGRSPGWWRSSKALIVSRD